MNYPSMNINEIDDDYTNDLLDKLSKENKTVFLFTDFNINLLNYDIHNEFLESLSSNYFPIFCSLVELQRTVMLIGNIFSDMVVPNTILVILI